MPSLERAQCAAKECRSVVGWCSNNLTAGSTTRRKRDVLTSVGWQREEGAGVFRAVLADSSPARPPSAEQDAQVRATDDPVIIEVSGCAC